MAITIPYYSLLSLIQTPSIILQCSHRLTTTVHIAQSPRLTGIRCSAEPTSHNDPKILKTCKNCKTQFDLSANHPRACRFHTAHFGGETKRKFESVYSGGTMNTPDSGLVFQYWHCCGSEDPFYPGCTAAPHASYDDSQWEIFLQTLLLLGKGLNGRSRHDIAIATGCIFSSSYKTILFSYCDCLLLPL